MPTQGEIRAAMESAGLKEIEGNHFTQLNADEGFCKGACLDWVRRVLQGRVVFGYERTGNAKGQKREAQMREVHAILSGRVFAEVTAMDAEMEQRTHDLAARGRAIPGMTGAAQDEAYAAYEDDAAQLNADLRAYGERAAMGPLAAGWSRVSQQLDARAAATRQKSPSTMARSFANITPTSGSADKDLGTPDRVLAAIGKVVRELASGSASMFMFKPASHVGHAIGIARAQLITALFDPSYGMYFGPTVEPALKGFTYLLNTVYPGSSHLEFTVFVKKQG